ncbi:eukaryotic initiation factor-2 alpha kinase-A [Theileria orientalis strain Shintoku]|uniref:non-specific serine/threonine protein kinase n=1 Tax=Theileria orientalis strain Shintoku TaxID=869250 RepID=J4CCM6_THEOR|nr:eukaryotic initiation factor-2 alpha kinase-A [Theileria orientalis strain Shintoku]BAM39657.1 eukaryotic initiation factor-2 alpha kinase-A [Theileria orientalis strain Shintoku]|eukprot:XP_009689958.1 eukaryotic initiation factor-2 alpha kinase-A [Theileria orientalis strain Shintoku]
MESYLREDVESRLQKIKLKPPDEKKKITKVNEKNKKAAKSYVKYSSNSASYENKREGEPLLRFRKENQKRREGKGRLASIIQCILHFSILVIVLNVLYSRSAENKSSRKKVGLIGTMRTYKYPLVFVSAEVSAEDGRRYEEESEEEEVKQEHKEKIVRSNVALVENMNVPKSYEEVSLLVLDTEGLTYRTDLSKKLIWATRLTEDLLRVKKPKNTRQQTCAIENIVPDNIDKNKTMGHKIFLDKEQSIKVGKEKNKDSKRGEEANYEKLKSHLIPSYDGYVYYVDDYNTKLLKVHVKDIVNYTPFYTPLLEGVYLEGSRNALVIALDYETGTYITRHNREQDTKNSYVLNYFVKEKSNDQLHIALTNWSVKAYTEKGHTQIWEFDWLEVGSVMNQNKNESLVKSMRDKISVSANRLYFREEERVGDEREEINHLAFPYPISAVFAISKTHREGIYTLELIERLHIPPPPSFLYDSSVKSALVSSRKIAHKSLYVENGTIKRIGKPGRLMLYDGNNRRKLETLTQGQENMGLGVDEKRIIVIGSSVGQQKGPLGVKESTYDFLLNWWWLVIFWVIALLGIPVGTVVKVVKFFTRPSARLRRALSATETPSSRMDVYDSRTELYDSTEESSEEYDTEEGRDIFENIEEEYSDFSVDGRLELNDSEREGVKEIRRAKSEGNFEYEEEEYAESVWMEEQSLIDVVTNNQYDLVRRSSNPLNKLEQQPGGSKSPRSGGKMTTGSTKEHTTAMITSTPASPQDKNATNASTEREEDKRDDKKELSVIPTSSVLSKFLENGRFLRTFECIKMLGKGGFGSVYRARHKLEPGNPVYAIKFVLLKLKASEDLSSRRYFREVAANRDIYSKYVVRYYTWWCEEPHFLPLAQMSTQLQTAAIDNLRCLLQNGVIPPDLINPEREKTESEEEQENDEENRVRNHYIREYRKLIYQYIQNPGPEEQIPSFSQIAQKNKNNVKFLSSLNVTKENNENNLQVYSENSNIQFKDTNTGNNEETKEKKRNKLAEKIDEFKKKLSIINECDSKHNENKQYQVVLLILMEMCNGLTLREWLNKPDRSKENRRVELLLFKQIIKGLRDIHRNCFIHRDLKPENIFVDDKNNLKIGDLGLVGFIQESHPNSYQPINTVKQHLLSDATQVSVRGQVIGTPGYTAPEGGGNCTEKVDIYSAALILLELLCPKFNTVMERLETLERFRSKREVPPFIKERYNPWYELMVKMGDANPENRPSADQVYRQLKAILSSS